MSIIKSRIKITISWYYISLDFGEIEFPFERIVIRLERDENILERRKRKIKRERAAKNGILFWIRMFGDWEEKSPIS